ncbi:hypothetical protein ABPG74_002142 [Tetrahymena malaccensis]
MSYPQFDTKNQVQKLTSEEKAKNQNAQGMYILIKVIDSLERQHVFDNISDDVYKQNVIKNLQKVDAFKKQIPNFNIDSFCQEYGLQECTWAIERIKSGYDNKDQMDDAKYFVFLNNKFLEIKDYLYFNKQLCEVNQIRLKLDDLFHIIQKRKDKFSADFMSVCQQLQNYYKNVLQNKQGQEVLSEQEYLTVDELIATNYQKFQQYLL